MKLNCMISRKISDQTLCLILSPSSRVYIFDWVIFLRQLHSHIFYLFVGEGIVGAPQIIRLIVMGENMIDMLPKLLSCIHDL
jgi:hypothetical protein